MKIVKIKLENIKSYGQGPIIEFHPGVNFISGKNGCGKTTILEGIGYALFDYNPYSNIVKIIREGHKRGKITVWFSFDDDILYRVERDVGKGITNWRIYEEGDETEIVSGKYETKTWIGEKLGMPEGKDISKIYSDIIGVTQGEITTYFKISSETKRKDHFNPILGIEDYREAYKKTSSLPNSLLLKIERIDSEIKQIGVKTEKYDEKKAALDKIETEFKKIKLKFVGKKKEFELKDKELKNLEKIRDRINKLETKLKVAFEAIKNKKDKIGKLKKEVTDAQKASNLVKKKTEGYTKYLKAEEKHTKEEGKKPLKKELENKEQKLRISIKSAESGIQTSKRENLKNEKKLKEKIILEKKKESEISKPYKQNLSKLKLLNKDLHLIKELEKQMDLLNTKYDGIKQVNLKIKGLRLQVKKKNYRIDCLKEDLKKIKILPEIEKNIKKLKSEIKIKEGKIKALDEKIESYEQSISKGGICPILNKTCERISEDILTKKIRDLKKQITMLSLEIGPRNKDLNEFENKRDELIRISSKKDSIKEEMSDMFKLKEDIKDLEKQISVGNINTLIKKIKSVFKRLKFSIKIKDLKNKSKILEDLSLILGDLKIATKELKKEINRKKTICERIKTEQETKLQHSMDYINKLKEELEEVRLEKDELKEKTSLINNEKKKLGIIKLKLKPLVGLDKSLDGLNKIIKLNKRKYLDYIANIKEAKSLEKRKKQLENTNLALKKESNQQDFINNQLSIIEPKFKLESYSKLKSIVSGLLREKTEIQSLFEEFGRNAKKLNEEIKEMEKYKINIKRFEKNKKELEEVYELLKFIRDILNRVGKPIAQRYLNTLSASANLIYNTLSDEKVEFTWEQDYMIRLRDNKGVREFIQLSGGEQMCAALAVQLALAKEFSNVGTAIFDEPTSNLDDSRCDFLAETLGKVRDEYGFQQLFIISHDETFCSLTEQEIHLEKVEGRTKLV
ncbi:SMC family ATPase [Patescibacteria group bacterium]|nr:SMC family ATPase [Patescibacteria group bacterium]